MKIPDICLHIQQPSEAHTGKGIPRVKRRQPGDTLPSFLASNLVLFQLFLAASV